MVSAVTRGHLPAVQSKYLLGIVNLKIVRVVYGGREGIVFFVKDMIESESETWKSC